MYMHTLLLLYCCVGVVSAALSAVRLPVLLVALLYTVGYTYSTLKLLRSPQTACSTRCSVLERRVLGTAVAGGTAVLCVTVAIQIAVLARTWTTAAIPNSTRPLADTNTADGICLA